MKEYLNDLQILADKVDGLDERSWEDLVYDLDYPYHQDSLRKSWNVGKYSGYNVFKYFTELIKEDYSDVELQKLQDMKEEFYKERVKLQDNRRLINKDLREEARFENLLDVMKSEIDKLPKLESCICNYEVNTNVEASLLLSDIHYGLKVDNVINYYNCQECINRLQTLCTKTIEYCNKNLVNTLHLFLTGDLVSGIIQVSAQVDTEEDVATQVLHISEILSNFIVELKNHIPNVKVYGVCGNHSRITPDKKKSVTAENFERFIFEIIQLRTGVNVIQNGLETWLTCKIKDKNVFVAHGDRDSMNNIREHAINVSRVIPDICYLGHIHHMDCVDDCGTEIIMNGSVIGVDDYAMGLRMNTKPYQIMQIFDNDDTQIIKINL